MRSRVVAVALVAGSAVGLVACSGNNFRDVKGVKSRDPDKIELFNNIDKHPNIAKVCIDGVAFATTTRDLAAITRVPEWDKTCPGYTSG